MKNITLLSAAALLALGACERSPAERQAEQIEERTEERAEQTEQVAEQRAEQVERQAEGMEQRAEQIREQGEQRAEAIEELGEKRAGQVEELGERREERMEQREERQDEARPGGPGGVAAPGTQDRWSDESQRSVVEQIRKDLVQDEQLSMVSRNVVIAAEEGRIVLKGFVTSEQQRQLVVEKAKKNAGQLTVDDQLKVSSLPQE